MSACPAFLIQLSLLFSLAWSLVVAVASFVLFPYPANLVGGIFGTIFFALSACYACAVWRRIPFAAANLNTGLTAIKTNAGAILVVYSLVVLAIGYSVMWMTALVGVYDAEGLLISDNDTNTTTAGGSMTSGGSNTGENELGWGYLFLLLLAYFW